MKFHTEFFKSVTKNAITSHPDLRLEKIELGEFLIDKYDNNCLPYFDDAGNLDSIQHQDNYNWFTLYTLIVDLKAKLLLQSSIDALVDNEDKFESFINRDTQFVINHCEETDWEDYHSIRGFNGISSSQLEEFTFQDEGSVNWKKYFKDTAPNRLYSFSNADYKVVCYKTLKPESMENLMYSYLLKEINKFELYNEQDEGCYIDDEDEIGCSKLYNGLYLINKSAGQTIKLEYEYDRNTNQFIIPYFNLRDHDDVHICSVNFMYDSFFELIGDGILGKIIELWLSPDIFMDDVIDDLKKKKKILIIDDAPF